jgi:hypothetical protein
MAMCDVIDVTVLERELDDDTQQIFFYHDKHVKTSKCDEQFEIFKEKIESGNFKFLLENPIADHEKTELLHKIKNYLNVDAEKRFVDQGLIYFLAKEDFGYKAPTNVDSLRCPRLIDCLEALMAEYSCFDEKNSKLHYKQEPEILKEIIDEIEVLITDEAIEEWAKCWDEARNKVEKLLKKSNSNREWLEENRKGIEDLMTVTKQVADFYKNFEYGSIENWKACFNLHNETKEMFDSVNLSLEKAKEKKVNRHGWNDGVEFESLIEFLDEGFSKNIVIVAGRNHIKRLIKILRDQEFSENEELSLAEKIKFDLPQTSTTNKENGESPA